MIPRVPVLALCFSQILLLSFAFGSNNFKVAIVNQDAHQIEEHDCKFTDACSLKNISCRYLAELKRQPISAGYHANLDTAVQALKKLDVSAVVYLNENFTDAFVARMALGDDADSETINAAQIHVWLEPTKPNDSLKHSLQTAFDHFTKGIMSACGFTRDDDRFSFEDPFQYRYV